MLYIILRLYLCFTDSSVLCDPRKQRGEITFNSLSQDQDKQQGLMDHKSPKEMRSLVIRQYHTQHHSGINKTYRRIQLTWFWPGMVGYIRRAVNSCEICQSAKHSRDTQVQSQQRLFAGRPWQVVSLDLVGPLQKTPRGNSMILVISDHFTRWKDAIAIPDGTAITIVETLERQVFNYFGLPERIHTDRGAQFEGQLLKELCQLWKVDKSK